MQENLSRKKKVPQSHEPKFLLDENVSNNLRKLLISNGYDVINSYSYAGKSEFIGQPILFPIINIKQF